MPPHPLDDGSLSPALAPADTAATTFTVRYYPSRGFDRVEYSVYDARIHQVRADGTRRLITIPRWLLNRHDWQVFVNAMLAHTSNAAGGKHR